MILASPFVNRGIYTSFLSAWKR